ncbi:sugar kinase -putative transcriptional regulator [Lactobacillus amylovorus]|jgi:glucokinase|uniref:Sugar kinase-putative transcriptional regulator n=1 Tax=Lactobacillus amylovorus TaxID=1604 RepID=F0TEI5_LACAM|nr:ROK family protein [Lactobacillus amylovorus]MCI1494687.1 ROK family protein [Lactobacillus crispatus]ADZ07051.1 sugar kinase -putative transcriptional regulator [Lactobacillus amylovorus]MCH3996534.1 ROK family protein [Lactobacillus amylovorus]MCI1525415.1 ROK family protein [Lactobacillus crispatus]MCI1531414.1 ROK family protein [Lactobacillus amylovorus]
MDLAAIDIGGTTIKIATWKDNQLQDKHAVDTPKDLESFYQVLTNEVNKIKENTDIKGVAISSPGAVNQKTGIIGGSSAIPYIHNFKIVDELEKRFGLPVSIENDANSAALGELAEGSGKGCDSMAFFVIGTGIGGALIINHKVWHGAHLFGGEFGYMIMGDHTLSELASPVSMANRYNERTGKHLDGKTIFELADQDDPVASDVRQTLIHSLAVAIYNIQHSFDPEKIVLGGGISNNPELIPLLNKEIDRLRDGLDLVTLKPDIVLCKLKSEANLRGAVADFEQNHQ